MKRATEHTKKLVISDYLNGDTVDAISAKYGFCRRQIYVWLENVRKHGYNTPGHRRLGIDKKAAEVILKLIANGIEALPADDAAIASVLEKKLLTIADDLTQL